MIDASIATGRTHSLFAEDWANRQDEITALVGGASVLVVGGAGAIGSACVELLLELGPARLHIIDQDENGLARLARLIRGAAPGAGNVDLFFLAADFAGYPAAAHLASQPPFDLVLDLAAVKHVRSEKSLPALLHMIEVNIVKQDAFFRRIAATGHPTRCFAVSTDKAADPVSFMGATKRVLEETLFAAAERAGAMTASSARFANVAFSSGSLLESFGMRLAAGHPLAAPRDTRRFFLSAREAAQTCLLAAAACPTGQLLVPRLEATDDLVELADVAAAWLDRAGYRAKFVATAAEARDLLASPPPVGGDYPVLLTPRDTVGEKPFEIFRGADETVTDIGLSALRAVTPVRSEPQDLDAALRALTDLTHGVREASGFDDVAAIIRRVVPNFRHSHGEGGHLDTRL